MTKVSIYLFIFVLSLFRLSIAQRCLSLAEFQNIKTSKQLMKQFIMELALPITSAQIPQKLGQRIKYLAEGSFGKVYQYLSPSNKDIAVKFIQKTKMEHQTLTFDYDSLFLEINANSCMVDLINLNPEFSSKFVVLKGVFYVSDTDQFLMVMNYYPLDLDKYQKQSLNCIYNYATRDQVKIIDSIIYNLAKALQFMHNNNLSHRDLKPANVMMNGSNPMFMDFGLTTPEANNFSTIAGTPYFIDPKLLATGQGGKETDIYALGIMIYVLLNGPSSYGNINAMMKMGNWGQENRAYDPNINMLKFPKKYGQLAKMLNTAGKRPDIDEIVETIETIQGIGQLPAIDERHLYGGQNMMPKPKFEQEVKVYKRPISPDYQRGNQHNQKQVAKMEKGQLKYVYPEHIQQRKPQGYPEKRNQLNNDEGILYDEIKYKQAQELKHKFQNDRQNPNQIEYQPIRKKQLPREQVIQKQTPQQPMTEAQLEIIRVQKLAAQNKARHLKDNGIFFV